MYIYNICLYYIYIYKHIYTYIERERERKSDHLHQANNDDLRRNLWSHPFRNTLTNI